MSRAQFYSCLKLIGAYQATVPLRQELISSTITLPLPKFSWTTASTNSSSAGSSELSLNGGGGPTHPNLMEAACRAAAAAADQDPDTLSQLEPSTDSEVEHTDSVNGGGGLGGGGGGGGSSSTGGGGTSTASGGRQQRQHRRGGGGEGSPEAWSTASDSPTPTNSVTERPWAKNTLWQGLFCEEQRQLLGTEEESSDRHSSDDDNETAADLEQLYQITAEQREYYLTQFRAVQPDPNGLLAGITARMFFEKSRIPVEELRHIWKLCDVTRDGALSLAEFTAAMHLVVLRRNNIPLPPHLPACLMPTSIVGGAHQTTGPSVGAAVVGPPEADLLHLDDDAATVNNSYSRMIPPADGGGGSGIIISNHGIVHQAPSSSPIISATSSSSTKSTTPIAVLAAANSDSSTIIAATISSPQQQQQPPPPPPPTMPRTAVTTGGGSSNSKETDWMSQSKEWTKFTESPTSNVSSPGPKPVNFDMQRTAQAVVSDPLILHPVPVRVTPICGGSTIDNNMQTAATIGGGGDSSAGDGDLQQQSNCPPPPRIINVNAATLAFDTATATAAAIMRDSEASPKHHSFSNQRDSLQNELRAIQRPQPKKVPTKNVGAIPPPPQRDQSGGGGGGGGSGSIDHVDSSLSSMGPPLVPPSMLTQKKDAPPLPPPRLVS